VHPPTTALVWAALALSACGTDFGNGLVEPEAAGLRLTAAISSPIVPLGTTALITYRLQNLTSAPVRLTFSSSCQVLPFIQEAGGEIVDPRSGSWGCFAVITSLALAPYGEHVVTREVRGGAPQPAIHTSVPLDPGDYRAYAVLASTLDGHLSLRSPDVAFQVR
jgi:hypothetical protein